MKTELTTLFVTSLAVVSGYGAVYNVFNGTSPTSNANGIAPTGVFSDPDGAPKAGSFTGMQSTATVPAGIVAFGIFFATDAELRAADSLTNLVSAFKIFGTSGAFNQPGPTGYRGVFVRNTSATVTGTPFAGQNIYAFVGNGTTFANSTELAIIKSASMFEASQDAIPTAKSVILSMATSTLIFGVMLENVKTTNNDASTTPGWGMAGVPETSTALLGALGSLVFLRRRR